MSKIVLFCRCIYVRSQKNFCPDQHMTKWPGGQTGKPWARLKSWGFCRGQAKVREPGQPGAPGAGRRSHDRPQGWCQTQGYQSHWHTKSMSWTKFFLFLFLLPFWRLIFQEWTCSTGNHFVNFIVFHPTLITLTIRLRERDFFCLGGLSGTGLGNCK